MYGEERELPDVGTVRVHREDVVGASVTVASERDPAIRSWESGPGRRCSQ